jgi:integrase
MTEQVRRAGAPVPKKTQDGTWGFVFDSRFPKPDGSRRQIRRRGFATQKAAKAAMQRLLEEDRPAGDLTVGDVLDRFVLAKERQGRAPNTLAMYRWAVDRLKARWGGWSAEDLLGQHLDEAYTGWLSSGRRQAKRGRATVTTDEALSPRAVEILHKTLKAAYALELRRRGSPLRWNPADDAVPPTVVEQKRSWWSPEQVAKFLVHAAESDELPVGLVDMLVDTGGRRGEVVALRWADVDLDQATARVTRQLVVNSSTNRVEVRPTKRPRAKSVVSLHPNTVVVLKLRRRLQAEDRLKMGAGWPGPDSLSADLVFTWADGRMIRPDTLTRIVARMSVEAGLPRLTPHGIRHSFATAALEQRVPVDVVAARLGNTTRVVQEVYRHVIHAEDREAAQTVGDLFRRPADG